MLGTYYFVQAELSSETNFLKYSSNCSISIDASKFLVMRFFDLAEMLAFF